MLAALAPERFPCFADEAAEGAGFVRDYRESVYLSFAAALSDRAKALGADWNPELVGRALWAEGLHSLIAAPPASKSKAVAGAPAAAATAAATAEAEGAEEGKPKRKRKRKRCERESHGT